MIIGAPVGIDLRDDDCLVDILLAKTRLAIAEVINN